MAKVLISFLGTGPKDGNRNYKCAPYKFSDGTIKETPFIAKALAEYYQIDRIILIGTVKSMWEEVYRQFAEAKGIIDEDIYFEIAGACDAAHHDSDLFLPHQNVIEEVLGTDSHVMLIKYGLNEEEVNANATTILGIDQYLDRKDELYIDITHSFRSLPLFLMNCLIYLKNVSDKDISIAHITYGMLDVIGELRYAPVVELNEFITTNEWISGAYSFAEFGNAYKIAQLLEEENKDVAKRLNRFSDLMNLNHLSGIQHEAQSLSGIKNKNYSSPLPEMIVKPVITRFINDFIDESRQSHFQGKLACWQFHHKNYCASYISLLEAIVTLKCEEMNMDSEEYDNRKKAKDELKKRKGKLFTLYENVKNNRNTIAHSIRGSQNYTQMINVLEQSIQDFFKILN